MLNKAREIEGSGVLVMHLPRKALPILWKELGFWIKIFKNKNPQNITKQTFNPIELLELFVCPFTPF